MTTAIFPGSFNPFTIGHKWVADQALNIFGNLIIAIGYNVNKPVPDDLDKRIEAIRKLYASDCRVAVRAYSGLTVNLAKEVNAEYIVRGVRNTTDFEYEKTMADINREIGGMETVFIPTPPHLSAISSSMVRELEQNGFDTLRFIPVPEDGGHKP